MDLTVGVETPNFYAILSQYGVTYENGYIFEGDTSNMLYSYPDTIVEEADMSDISNNMDMFLRVCMIDAGSIILDEENADANGIEYSTIATTSDTSFLRTNANITSESRTSSDSEEKEMTVAAMATKKINDNTSSKAIIYTNELMGMDYEITIGNSTITTEGLYNNEDAILNSIAYLTEKDNLITIRKDTSSESYLEVTEEQNNIIKAIIFISPFFIIFIGILVWQIRRRKK